MPLAKPGTEIRAGGLTCGRVGKGRERRGSQGLLHLAVQRPNGKALGLS